MLITAGFVGGEAVTKVQVNKRHTPGGGQYEPGDVRWVDNLSMGNGQSKSRPVIIVRVDGNDVLYYQCTSQSSATRKRYAIVDTISAGLDHDSFVDLELKRMPKSRLGRKLGHLDDYDMEGLGL